MVYSMFIEIKRSVGTKRVRALVSFQQVTAFVLFQMQSFLWIYSRSSLHLEEDYASKYQTLRSSSWWFKDLVHIRELTATAKLLKK